MGTGAQASGTGRARWPRGLRSRSDDRSGEKQAQTVPRAGEATIHGMPQTVPLVELHQHLDGSIPPRMQWDMMRRNGLNPVATFEEMEGLLVMQGDEEGSLLS